MRSASPSCPGITSVSLKFLPNLLWVHQDAYMLHAMHFLGLYVTKFDTLALCQGPVVIYTLHDYWVGPNGKVQVNVG